MPDCRLPKLVWQHTWQEGRRQGGQVKMWDAHTQEVAESVGMEEFAAVCDAADSYGAYKKRVSMAVRQRDMQVAQTDALQQSTLARYLPMLGPDVTAVPNTMQPYLAGIGPTVKSRLKLQFRSVTSHSVQAEVNCWQLRQSSEGYCLPHLQDREALNGRHCELAQRATITAQHCANLCMHFTRPRAAAGNHIFSRVAHHHILHRNCRLHKQEQDSLLCSCSSVLRTYQ
jgi:hypothetical protein